MKSKIIQNLIDQFAKMPSIGIKTAERLAYYIINSSDKKVGKFVLSVNQAKNDLGTCKACHNISSGDLCDICSNDLRDKSVICVVESCQDILAIEKMDIYKGVYHVLSGVLSPLDGIGPSDIKIGELIKRLKENSSAIKEVIIATNPNINGEATALYLTKAIKQLNIRVTRIGMGMALGSGLAYVDKSTLMRSFESKQML